MIMAMANPPEITFTSIKDDVEQLLSSNFSQHDDVVLRLRPDGSAWPAAAAAGTSTVERKIRELLPSASTLQQLARSGRLWL